MKIILEKELSSLPPSSDENTNCPEEILLAFAFEQVRSGVLLVEQVRSGFLLVEQVRFGL